MSNTAIAYILIFSTLLALALFRNPRYGLYAYIGTFYLHPVDRWWGSDLPEWRWSLIAAAVTLVATLRFPAPGERPGWSASTGAKLLITLTAWIWIQNFWALSPEDHFELSILYTKYLVLLYLIYQLVDDELAIRNFLIAHVLGCFYLGILILQAPDTGRLESVGGPGINEANALGMHLGTGALAAAALLAKGSMPQRLFSFGALAVIANGIVQTESRGAFLGLAVGGLTLLYLSPDQHRRLWIVLGALGLAVLVRVAPDNFWERMSTISTTAKTETAVDQSSQTRLVLLEAQWKMFLAYPLGSGHRGTAALSPRYLDEQNLARSRNDPTGRRARSSHNTFMTALTEQGIPGAVLFGGLVLWIARTIRRSRTYLRDSEDVSNGLHLMVIGASLSVVLVAGMFTDYFKAEVFVWGIALLCVISSAAAKAAMNPSNEGPAPGINPSSNHPALSPTPKHPH